MADVLADAIDAFFAQPRAPRVRIRTPAGGDPLQAITVTADPLDRGGILTNQFPAKEWAITDDVLNVADTACVTVANDDGENAGKFALGQRIEIDISDPDVAGGQWLRQFTGRITALETCSDLSGGSVIQISAMDLGWHLTSSAGPPLFNLKGITFNALLSAVIDPSWGFGPIVSDASLNTRLKHGRQVIIINHKPVLGAVLPFIQIEPGQSPWDVIRLYAARNGVLINVGARGELIFFQPQYNDQPLYDVEYHPAHDLARNSNNIVGRPTLRETIDGRYTEVQCWSTVVIPPEIQNTENPNEAYRHATYKPTPRPLPFNRRHVFSDPEAINQTLRLNRAVWKYQMDLFNSWEYSCEFNRVSQGGALFVSNTMISVNDAVNGVTPGAYYLQAVRKSCTMREGGPRAKLTVRRPGLLNPALNSLLGGGAQKAAALPPAVP